MNPLLKIKKPKKVLSVIEQIQRQEDRRIFKILDEASGISTMKITIQPCSLGFALIATPSQFDDNTIFNVEIGASIEVCVKSFTNKQVSNKWVQHIEDGLPNQQVVDTVLKVLNGGPYDGSLVLHLGGTHFQRQVWEALKNIQPGTTETYHQVADRIGSPSAVRAVANAIGANPIAVLIPCHRVVRSDGGLGGYRWGEDIKRKLLFREKSS